MNKSYLKDTESTLEYSLPDYMGDVKKILTVSASAVPSGKFISDGSAEFSGIVVYDVLYSDAEGKLTHLAASSDYDVSVPIDPDTYKDSMAEPRVSNLSVRLTGPRKLIIKTAVSNSIKTSESDETDPVGNVFADSFSPECARKVIKRAESVFGASSEREYAESAERLNGISADDIEILATSGAVRITESTPEDGGVLVKGELIITSILRTSEQPAFVIRKSIPFEERIAIDGILPDMQTVADGYITSATTGISEDADGCDITVNAIAEFYCEASENRECEVLADVYLTSRDTNAVYEDYKYTTLVCGDKCETALTSSVKRADIDCTDTRNILTLVCDLRQLTAERKNGGFEIKGDAAYSGVACEMNDENEPVYSQIKFTSPVSIFVSLGREVPEGAKIDYTVSVISNEALLDSENLSVKSMLKIGYKISEENTVHRVKECNTVGDIEYKECASVITVYYPEADESLFEIAKRYHTTGAKIALDNALSESVLASSDSPSSLSGVKRLIIR